MKPEQKSFVLLRDGSVLGATSEQMNSLGIAILMSKDLTQKIKLGGRVFRLDEIEDDPEKIAKSKQNPMYFND